MTPLEQYPKVVRVFVACPGDLAKEKELLGKVITSLNNSFAPRIGIVLELKEWS